MEGKRQLGLQKREPTNLRHCYAGGEEEGGGGGGGGRESVMA